MNIIRFEPQKDGKILLELESGVIVYVTEEMLNMSEYTRITRGNSNYNLNNILKEGVRI